MSELYESKARTGLEQLGLTVACDQLDSVAQQSAAANWSYTHFLGDSSTANWPNAIANESNSI